MKKNYAFIKQVALVLLLVFAVHLGSYAQTRSKSSNTAKQPVGKNISHVYARGTVPPPEVVTSCGPYTWPTTGQTYTSTGTYTSNGITQGFTNQTTWNNSVNSFNTIVATNSLGGLTNTNPIPLTVGSTSVSLGATGGMYTTGVFVGTNIATDALTITLGPGVYGFAANIYATDITDAVTTGDITVTYSTGFVDARTVSSASEFFGYTSTTPITSVTITCANTVAPFKWPTINNLALATNPIATLDLTIQTAPVTGNYSVCQGQTVSGGLTSDLGGAMAPTPLPNYSGDNTGGPTYNRPTAMNQGGTCGNSGVGNAVQYVAHTFTAPASGDYIFSTCGGATFDTFLSLYQAPFDPAGLCAGNTLIESSDDVCGAQSTVTATLVGGTTYVLVVSGFGNTDAGAYTVTSTTPTTPVPGVEWYTASTGGTAIGIGSPFNPVGVAGSGLTDTNTIATTTFYAQFPGESCRMAADFIVTPPSTTPTFTAVAPICIGETLTALPTTSNNGITGTWSPALDATTTTTYTFTPDAGQCATTTTLTITVNDLPTITCPGNISACEGDTVNYSVTTNSTSLLSLTQNTSSVAAAGAGIGCNPGGDNTYYRVYDLAALGYTTDMPLANIKFSVQSSASDRLVTVSAYTLTGALTNENLTLLGSTTLTATASTSIIDYTAPMGGLTVPGGSTLVISYAVASSTGNSFIGGANAAGQSSPCYLKATDCGVPQPTSLTALGFPTIHVILNAEFTQASTPTLVTGLPSGSVFPLGTTTVTYEVTNSNGCSSTCSFDVTVAPSTATFTQVAPICVGGTLDPLPTTSNNGVTGTWSPAIDATTTTTYTFTPDAGQCAVPTTMTIVVNPLPTVNFTANPFPVCAGTSTVLSANVTNATPTITNGAQTFSMNTAAFGVPVTTPLTGLLFDTASLGCTAFAPGSLAGKIALIQRGTCAFAVKAQNAQDAGAIGVILYNNVAGGIIPGGTAPGVTIPVYGITLADGQALIASMTANEVSVTLNPAPPLTYLWGNGDTTQTTNTGVLNADTDFTVTVTNTVTGCSNTVTVTVPVTANTVPTFTQVADICSGGTFTLPTTSDNGVAGTWSPAIDNTTTTTYTFTPTPIAGQCLGSATMTVTVNTSATPTGDAVQTVSVSNPNDATLANLVVTPSTVTWYPTLADAQAGTNALPNSTVLTSGSTYYAVNVTGACSSEPFGVTVTVTLGNDQFDNVSFAYWPNPTSSILNISYSKVITQLSVTNVLGQQVMSKETNSTEVQIDLSGLAEATYFIKVTADGVEKTIKVVKKN